jgi:hypothetical protein
MIVEVLVHISTPATKQNDNLYRSLAGAYLDFEPQERHGGVLLKAVDGQGLSLQAGPGPGPGPGPGHDAEIRGGSRQPAAVESSISSTSRESYGSFPSYISSGCQVEHSDGSIPTSSRLARLDCIHKRWKEQTTPRPSFTKRNRPAISTLCTSGHAEAPFIEDTQLGAQALQSQLQDNYSTTSEDTSEDETEIVVPLPRTSTTLDSQRSTVNEIIEVPVSLHPTSIAASHTINVTHTTSSWVRNFPVSSPAITIKKQKIAEASDTSEEVYDFSILPTNAFPLPPKISTQRPNKLPSQITKQLATIQAQNPERFKPSKRYTIPKPDDRGYWSVTSSTWPAKSQHEFWTALYNHVYSGRLGWGVTLHRDASSPGTLGPVRLYCWAEVAEHTWLLLWLCSKGKIVDSGSRWIDADGNVVYDVAQPTGLNMNTCSNFCEYS